MNIHEHHSSPSINDALDGALAGVAGGLAMSVLSQGLAPKMLPDDMRPDEFVPRQVVEWAERAAGAPDALSDAKEGVAAMGAHLGYSALLGAGYGLLRSYVPAPPTPVAGALYGVATWAFGFEGLLPALGVRPPTTAHPPKRWPAPIMGHVVFGVVTALAYEAAQNRLR